jgi:glycosyltransferase involved in cell wall biosynthesis
MSRTVLHLVTSLNFGGTERQVAELLRGLASTRWRAELVVFRKTGGFLPDVQALGLDPIHLPLAGSLARLRTLGAIAALAARLRRAGARLLHCHDVYAAIVGVPAARLAGVPVVTSRRDLGHHLTRELAAALRVSMSLSTCVLANAATVAAQTEREAGVPASKLAVVPNGLDLERFDRRTLALDGPAGPLARPGCATVVTVARATHPAKGHDDLLDAAALVRRVTPTARFLVVGNGPRQTELEERARATGVDDIVTFLGKRADVPAILRRADLVCHPSRSEGLPNAVLEAMAASRPIVACAAGGVPELVQHDAHGLLVRPRAPAELAHAIVALLRDPAHAARLGLAARQRVEAHFTLDRLIERIDRLYERLASA